MAKSIIEKMLIALAIVFSCIALLFVFSIIFQTSDFPPPEAPKVSIKIAADESGIKLMHTGGDVLTLSNVKMVILTNTGNLTFSKVGQINDRFVAGDTLAFNGSISLNGRKLITGQLSTNKNEINNNPSKNIITITLIDIPTGKII